VAYLRPIPAFIGSRDGAVRSMAGYGLDDRGGRGSSPSIDRNSLFSMFSGPALRLTQPPIKQVPGALSSEVKRPERDANNSPPTSDEVKET
jgi:hypothetical protein